MKGRPRSYLPYIMLAVIILLMAVGMVVRRRNQPKPTKTEAEPAVPVAVAPVSLGEMAETVPVTGTLRTLREAAIHPQVSARVMGVNVLEGDAVSQGQVLVTLDPTDFQAQVRQAQAGIASAEAAVRTTRAQSLAAQKRLQVLKAGARKEERAMAKSHLEQAEAALRQAQANFDRRQKLYQSGAISKEDLDAAQTAYDTARTNRDSAQESLQLTQKGPRPEEIQAAESEVSAAQQQVSAAEAGVAQARANLVRAEELLSYTTVHAPIGGVVYERKVDPGEIASTMGDPMLKVADLGSVYFEATVPGRLAPQVHAGQPVQIRFRGDGSRSYDGTVLKVVPVADPSSRDFLARVSVPKVEGVSRPGMYAEGQIVVEKRQRIPVISKDALIERSGRQIVFVVADDVAQERPVQLGMMDATRVEVTSGLRPGDLVVTAGAQTLQNGAKVAVQQNGG